MTAADLAALPKIQAVLIASGRRPALLQLLPWYTEP
jgi:type IV secretion system protein VirD4